MSPFLSLTLADGLHRWTPSLVAARPSSWSSSSLVTVPPTKSTTTHYEPATATLSPSPIAPLPSIEDAHPEPSLVDSLLTPKIQFHIVINVVSRLNVTKEARSLPVEEQSLREFLLDQTLFL
jgi:hypothetical protein